MVNLICQAPFMKIHMGYSYQFRMVRLGDDKKVTYD